MHGFCSTYYLSECIGLLSLLSYFQILRQYYPFLNPSAFINVCLDNSSLLTRVWRHQNHLFNSPSEALLPERDCLLQIESILDSVPLSFIFHHVKSHQDDDMPSGSLSPPAQANVRADSLATHARSHTQCNPVCPVFDAYLYQFLVLGPSQTVSPPKYNICL